MNSNRADWARLIVATLARVLLFSILGAVIWSAVPTVWGWKSTTVMSDSMAPGIRAGDVVVSMPVPVHDLMVGRVILVHNPDQPGELRLHRLVGMTSAGLITKGDANPQNDSTPVAPAQVVGVGFLRAPFVGLPILWVAQGHWPWVAAAVLLMIGIALLSGIDAHLRRRRVDEGRTRGRQRRRGTIALGTGAGLVILALVLGTGAHAAFAKQSANPSSSLGALATYPCLTVSPADSPYFFYAFQETSGTSATDSSGNGRTGTLQAGASRNAGSCALNASPSLLLNGSTTGQVVTASTAITAPSNYSIEAWFKTTTAGGKLVGFGNSASGLSTSFDRQIYLDNSGHVVFGARNALTGVQTVVSPSTYLNGAWHHVVAVMDNGFIGLFGGMTLYVDGVQVGSNGNTGSQSNTGYWRIGYDNIAGWGTTTPTNFAFTGSLDNVAVYTTVLTAAQVTAHYNAGH